MWPRCLDLKVAACSSQKVLALEDRDGNYYWQLQAASGRIIAISCQAYQSKYAQEVNWLRANANLIMVYDCTGESRQDQELGSGSWQSSTHPSAEIEAAS